MKKNQHKVIVTALFAAGISSMGLTHAQQASTPKVEKIEVTGSNIRRVDAESNSPIQVITADEIKRSGRQTVTELLRELPINAAGGLTELTGSGSFSTGAASVSLRGLGSSATLVLLNGRRIAPYGLADPNFGQASAVNLNAIPVAVIERIEILKDGASAIYGSEAIAGVVNIILRKDYKGGELSASSTANKDGLYRNHTLTATVGLGDLAKDRYNAFINFEGYKQDNVLFNDVRDFLLRSEYANTFGTGQVSSTFSPHLTYLNNAAGQPVASPGAGCPTPVPLNINGFSPTTTTGTSTSTGTACGYFQQFDRSEIVPKADRYSVLSRGSVDISANTQLFAEASFIKQKTFFIGLPQTAGQTGAITSRSGGFTFNSVSGLTVPSPVGLVVGHPNNPLPVVARVRARFDAVGPQDNEVTSKTTRGLVGVKTMLGKYDFESGLLYNRTEQTTTNYNAIKLDRLAQAFGFRYGRDSTGNVVLIPNLAGGTYNFANPASGQITPNMLRANPTDNAKSTFTILDAKLSGELFNAAGGAAGFALGAEYRKEDRIIVGDAEKVNGNIFGRGVSLANANRNVATVFGEVIIPVSKSVEVQAAVRYDRYSDFGKSVTPKLAASWAALSNVKLRASFARGFRAPSLTEITRSNSAGFFNGFDDPRRCTRPTVTVGCAISAAGLIFGNPDVKPEKAETYSAGFVWDISKDTSATVDYFSIARRNEIAFLSLANILANEGANNSLYAGTILRDPTVTDPSVPNDPGAIQAILPKFTNLGETRVRGFDIDIRHRISLGEYGRLTLQTLLTQYTDQRGNGAPGTPLVSFNNYRNPKQRGQIRASWSVGNWNNAAAVNFVGSFKSYPNPQPNAEPNCGNTAGTQAGICTVATYFTIDASTEYNGFKNWRLNLAVRNLANTRPPNDPPARLFNTTWYQPQGINFVLGARYSF
jgi:iron complex outermembrane recepter protein